MVDEKHWLKNFPWRSYDVRAAIQEELDASLLGYSGVLFFGGLVVSGCVGLWELSAEIHRSRG